MGDLVLGLAKTAVEGTLVKAKSAIDEEAKLKQSVQRDLVFITGEFQMMQCFLNTTNAEDGKNAVFKAWVRQLRDLAFDVEDCIEFVVHLDDKPAWWWRMVSLPSCIAPPLPLDVAVGDIKELKARVEEVSQRSARYDLVSDSGSRPVLPQQHPATADATMFDILVEARDAAKKHRGLWNLTELISREGSDRQVISLWGTSSDFGMKSIIMEAYTDPHICETFTCRAWVKLVHPFNPHEFIHSLLAQFYAYSCQEQGAVIGVDVLRRMVTEDLMGEFVQQMSKHRYLVVLEDLSTMVEWNAARTYLPDMNNGSRIVVSTQHFEIASLCAGHPNCISEIRQFSADHSVCILFKEGSTRDGIKCEDEVGQGVAPQPQGNFHPFQSEAAHILHILKQVDSEIRDGKNSLAFKVMSVWGIPGVGKSTLVRSIYRGQMQSKYSHRWGKYAWVQVPRPWNSRQFYRRLFWDLCSITTEDEEKKCFRNNWLLSDIENCSRGILREHRCLFVIDGLDSVKQWKEIDEMLELRNANGCTIVITTEESLAKHCADNNRSLVCNVKTSQHGVTHRLFGDQGSQCERSKNDDKVSHTISPESQDSFNFLYPRSEETYILNTLGMVDDVIRGSRQTDFDVISVWGIAGVGKSALIKSIYHNQMKFKYSHRWSKYGWVDVPHPFNLREFSRSLLLDILSSKSTNDKANEHYCMSSSTEDPIKECRDILREHPSLIVIDDLRSIEDWASISTALGLPSAKTRAIVITTEESVAMHCAKYPYLVFNVRSLEPDAALHLFKCQARVSDDDLRSVGIMKQVKLALNKCGGIPKVIIAMYRLVVFFDFMMIPELWQKLNANFMSELEKRPADTDGIHGLLVWVHKYLRSCPDFLKPCVFYLPIFPPNHNIRRRRLLRRWIAEGYCRDSVTATAEKNGDASFDKLVSLSMIHRPPQVLETKEMSMASCQVNGFFRECIISQPMEDNMVFSLEERCSQNSQYTGRHLVIQSSWDRDRYVFESIELSRLRSLTVFGGWSPFFISDKMKVLRVLDLEDSLDVTDDHVEQIVKLLPRLKFLSLRGCTSVSRLPTSIGNLKQLETLDVRHTSITKLPPPVINLQKLQYIRAGTTVQTQPRSKGSWLPKFCCKVMSAHLGVEVPKGIGKLKALDTLGVLNVGASWGKAILKELKNLTQVRKLGVSGINRENVKDLSSVMYTLGHLESLSIHLDKDEQDFFCSIVDGISEPVKENLKSLKLYGLYDMLPAWITKLVNIRKLDLEMTILTQEMIDYLSRKTRTSFTRLCVKPIQDVEHKFAFGRRDYVRDRPDLPQVFEIDCSSRFVLTFEGDITSLELLKVHCGSGSQISGLAHLEKLKRVWLMGSYDDTLKLDLERQLAEHPNKPVLQLEELSSDVGRDNVEASF